MAAAITISVLAVIHAWLGWKKKVRLGLISAFALSAVASLIAAFYIRVPGEVGGVWIFGVSFSALTAVSLGSLGIAISVGALTGRSRHSGEK